MVFEDINFEYEDSLCFKIQRLELNSSITHLVGQNGVGKSTLMNIFLKKTLKTGKKVSYIHQDYRQNWVWWLSVIENFNLSVHDRSKTDYKMTELWTENKVWLDEIIAKDQPTYSPKISGIKTLPLSGGQIQRLIFIRELLCRPNVLFLDEAFSAIDKTNKILLMKQLLAWQKKYNFQIINITHNKEDLDILEGEIILLSKERLNIKHAYFSIHEFKKQSYYEEMV